MPKLKRLSHKNKEFAKAYIKYKGNGKKAALAVLDVKESTAKNSALAQLDQPLVQAEIKRLFDKGGLSLEEITADSRELITKGLEAKPSFAAAAGHLEFIYKAHGVSPVNKSVSMKLSARQEIASQDVTQLTDELRRMNDITNKLLTLANK
jgi:hypothetical protein